MIIPTTTAKERMETKQPHAKRITSVISSFTSHRPINHAKRLPPYKLQQKPERMSRTDQPNNLCRGRLSLFLFPLCISLAVFIITTFFLCIDELSWLISCASKGRVQEKQGFWKKYLVPFMAQGRFFSKPERLDLVFPLRTRSTFALE